MYQIQQYFNCGRFSTIPVEWSADVRERHKHTTVPAILKMNQIKCAKMAIWGFWIGIV